MTSPSDGCVTDWYGECCRFAEQLDSVLRVRLGEMGLGVCEIQLADEPMRDALYKYLLQDVVSHFCATRPVSATGGPERPAKKRLRIPQTEFNALSAQSLRRLVMTEHARQLALAYAIERLRSDRPSCGATVNAAEVTKINAGLSDSHVSGQTVLHIASPQGGVVFKPRSTWPENFLGTFAHALQQDGLPRFQRSTTVIDKGAYGWAELVEYQPIDDPAALGDYYFSAGILCFVVALLGGTDLHHENIVCSGGLPQVVDAEGLFQPYSDILEPVGWEILRTGLVGLRDDATGTNLSGISLSRSESYSYAPVLVSQTNEDVEIAFRYVRNARQSANLPLRHRTYPQCQAIDQFATGFMRAQRFLQLWLAENGSKAIDLLTPNPPCTRVFLRPTRLYMTWQRARRAGAERPAGLKKLPAEVEYAELSALDSGCVPSFCAKLHSTSLFYGNEEVARNYFQCSPVEALEQRLGPRGRLWRTTREQLSAFLAKVA